MESEDVSGTKGPPNFPSPVSRGFSNVVSVGAAPLSQFILGTLPWTGGVGAVLATEAGRRQSIRVEALLADCIDRISRLETPAGGAFDAEFVDSDEFMCLLEQIVVEAAQTTSADKINYLKEFLTNAAKNARPDVTWLDLFVGYMQRISGSHIVLLERMYEVQGHLPASDRMGKVDLKDVPVTLHRLSRPGYGVELRRVCMADLANLSLVADWRNLSGRGEFGEAFSLTRNGLLFMKFVLGEWNLPPGSLPQD